MPYTLTTEELDALQDACDDEGIDLRTEYSGRAMYGATCIGIVADGIGSILRVIGILREDSRAFDLYEALSVGNPRTDSMGMQTIFYWPSIRVAQPEGAA